MELLINMIVGYLMQWMRAPKAIPNWMSYAVLTVASLALYAWMTPTAATEFAHDWRSALTNAVVTISQLWLTARGTAHTAALVGAAPKANSL